jgi:hypothetical protein
MSKPGNIGLVTVFLPRMELDHLREWIDYHRRIGVSRFFLYNNRHLSVDHAFGSGKEVGRVWHKKPEANYHLDLTDDEVDRRIDSTLEEFGDCVTHLPWPSGKKHGETFLKCQKSAANRELRQQEKLGELEWLGFIDLDELLVCVDPLELTLSEFSVDVAAIKLTQKVFLSRWLNGESQPYSNITKSFGTVNFNPKLIARVGRVKRWVSPHGLRTKQGHVWKAPPELLRFHHFRGNEHHGNPPPRGFGGVKKYCRLDSGQLEIDDSHRLPSGSEIGGAA